jgi:hypothetical protein
MNKLSKGEEQIHCIEAQMAGRTWRGALGVAQPGWRGAPGVALLAWRKWRGASVAAQLAVALMVTPLSKARQHCMHMLYMFLKCVTKNAHIINIGTRK